MKTSDRAPVARARAWALALVLLALAVGASVSLDAPARADQGPATGATPRALDRAPQGGRPTARTNLLSPDQSEFESGLAGWVTQGNAAIERSTTVAHRGSASLQITGSASDSVVDDSRTLRISTLVGTQGIPTRPGWTFEGSVSVMSPGGSPIRCELRWYDVTGTILSTSTGPSATGVAGSWSPRSCRAMAPASARYVALRVHVERADFGSLHYVDSASLVRLAGSVGRAPTPPETTAPTTTVRATTTTAAATTTTVRATTTTAAATTTTVRATTTTAAATTTTVRATTTTAPPSAPPSGGFPTSSSTGPTVANPQRVGWVEVFEGQSRTLTDVVADGIFVHPGGSVTATRVRVNGSVVINTQVGYPNKLHLTDTAVHNGLVVNAIDSSGSLAWGVETPVDVVITDSWVFHPQGDGQYHTEALAGFGFPRGVRFTNNTFIQQGPFNSTATGVINFYGADTVFDHCYFGWADGTAAYYTIYVRGRNNVVRNSALQKGLAGYVYPNPADDYAMATYIGNVDADTGAFIAL